MHIQRDYAWNTFNTSLQFFRIDFVLVIESHLRSARFHLDAVLKNRMCNIIQNIPDPPLQVTIGHLRVFTDTDHVHTTTESHNFSNSCLNSPFCCKAIYKTAQVNNSLTGFDGDVFTESARQNFQSFTHNGNNLVVWRILRITRITHKDQQPIIHLYHKFVFSIILNNTNSHTKLFAEDMVNMISKQSVHTLCRQEPVAFRRHLMTYRNLRPFILFIGHAIPFVHNNFPVSGLEKAFNNTWPCRPVKVKPVTRENSIVSIDFRIFGMSFVLTSKSKFLRKSDMDRSAVRTNAKQRDSTIQATIRRILFHRTDIMANCLPALPAVQLL